MFLNPYSFYHNATKLTVVTDNPGTSNDDQFTFPSVSVGGYNVSIYHGDGILSDITTWDDPAWTHTYPSAGEYTVYIAGTFTGLKFDSGGDRLKLTGLERYGVFKTGNQTDVFAGCANLVITATDILDISEETTLRGFIKGCESIVSIPNFASWDFSNIGSFRDFADGATLYNDSQISSVSMPNNTSLRASFRNTALSYSISNLISANVTDIVNTLNGSNIDDNFSGSDFSSVTDATNFLYSVALSTANYESLIILLLSQSLQNNVTFNFGNSLWTVGTMGMGRYNLSSIKGCDVSDGGREDSNLLGWFAASNVFAETSNPTDGSSLSEWSDLSGRDYDAGYTTTEPTFTTNALNGEPACTFDGSSSRFRSATNTFEQLRQNDFTIFLVAKSANTVSSPRRLFGTFDVTGSVQEIFVKAPANGRVMQFRTASAIVSVECDLESPNIYVCKSVDQTSLSIQVNGEPAVTGVVSQQNLFTDRATIGGHWTTNQTWDGDVYEVIVYNTILDADEENRIKTYLSDKYNISLTPGAGSSSASDIRLKVRDGSLLTLSEGSYVRVSGIVV